MDMTFLVGLMVGLFPVIALAQVIAARLHIPFTLILTGTGEFIGLGITALADGKLVSRTRPDGCGCETALRTGRCNPCVRRSSAVAGFAHIRAARAGGYCGMARRFVRGVLQGENALDPSWHLWCHNEGLTIC